MENENIVNGNIINGNVVKLYHNSGKGLGAQEFFIDKKFISGWTIESNGYAQWLVIYASFGKEFHLDKIKEGELCHEAYKWNMEQLVED